MTEAPTPTPAQIPETPYKGLHTRLSERLHTKGGLVAVVGVTALAAVGAIVGNRLSSSSGGKQEPGITQPAPGHEKTPIVTPNTNEHATTPHTGDEGAAFDAANPWVQELGLPDRSHEKGPNGYDIEYGAPKVVDPTNPYKEIPIVIAATAKGRQAADAEIEQAGYDPVQLGAIYEKPGSRDQGWK